MSGGTDPTSGNLGCHTQLRSIVLTPRSLEEVNTSGETLRQGPLLAAPPDHQAFRPIPLLEIDRSFLEQG